MKCNCGKGGMCSCGGMAKKQKMAYGGMAKKPMQMSKGGMTKKSGYRNGGFCTGPAKGYKK